MQDESIEDTYDWLDTDSNYPLDDTCEFGWKPWTGSIVGAGAVDGNTQWYVPYCTEHHVIVRSAKTASSDSTEEEKAEWIAENRVKIKGVCREQRDRQAFALKPFTVMPAGPSNTANVTFPVSQPSVTHVAVYDAVQGGNMIPGRELEAALRKRMGLKP